MAATGIMRPSLVAGRMTDDEEGADEEQTPDEEAAQVSVTDDEDEDTQYGGTQDIDATEQTERVSEEETDEGNADDEE